MAPEHQSGRHRTEHDQQQRCVLHDSDTAEHDVVTRPAERQPSDGLIAALIGKGTDPIRIGRKNAAATAESTPSIASRVKTTGRSGVRWGCCLAVRRATRSPTGNCPRGPASGAGWDPCPGPSPSLSHSADSRAAYRVPVALFQVQPGEKIRLPPAVVALAGGARRKDVVLDRPDRQGHVV